MSAACGPAAAPTFEVPARLEAFRRIEIDVGSTTWTVARADTPELRAQGLMGVTDLGDLDGMLFVWGETISASFWMKDTLIPLDIAFFAEDGALVDLFTMEPCPADPCPTYPAAGPFRYAVETTVGGFEGVGELSLGVEGLGEATGNQ